MVAYPMVMSQGCDISYIFLTPEEKDQIQQQIATVFPTDFPTHFFMIKN